jgi:CyaY protein
MTAKLTMMDESVYRQKVDALFSVIDAAFEPIDPDLAEALDSQGTLTILFGGKTRLILSPQTPVRQMWVAFKDRAWHFDFRADTNRWMDDRGRDIELFSLIEELTRDATGQTIAIDRTR